MFTKFFVSKSQWENSAIEISNTTSRWSHSAPVTLLQAESQAWLLAVPPKSFSESHSALLRITWGDRKILLTAKVLQVQRSEGEDVISVRLLQFKSDEVAQWEKSMVDRQTEIDAFLVSARGYE